MASKIAKLREEHKKEIALRKQLMKDVVIERKKKSSVVDETHFSSSKKIEIDSQKLQETIAKAIETSESLKKNPIVVLDKIPSNNNPVVPAAAPVAPVTICKARNLNGTPCKCKAVKFGKFCAKHTP